MEHRIDMGYYYLRNQSNLFNIIREFIANKMLIPMEQYQYLIKCQHQTKYTNNTKHDMIILFQAH